MIGMKPKDAIELKKFLLLIERIILQKIHWLKMDCIAICYNPVKNMTTIVKEQRIGNGLRRHTD